MVKYRGRRGVNKHHPRLKTHFQQAQKGGTNLIILYVPPPLMPNPHDPSQA